jgi:hypothetical protein
MAGARLAEAFVEVQMRLDEGSVRRARGQVTSATRAMEKAGKVPVKVDNDKLDDSLDKAEGSVASAAKAMAATFASLFTAKIVVDFFRDAIKGAADLEQAVGGTEAIFGRFAEGMTDDLEGAATSMGLSEQAARTLTSQIGGLLQGFGFTQEEASKTSLEIAQLGADLAATFGGNPEQAVEALGSALRGEFNPLEQFGISLNQAQINLRAVELGLADSTNEVDLNARAQAALSLIMERSTAAQGQFARESDTAAGKAAILRAEFENQRAEIGQQLLPVYTRALGILGELLDVFSTLPAPVQTAILGMAGIAAVLAPLSRVITGFNGLTSIISKLGALGAASGPIGLLALGIGGAVLSIRNMGAEERELEKWADQAGTALATQWRETARVRLESEGAESAVVGLAAANEALAKSIVESGERGEELNNALGTIGRQTGELIPILTSIGKDPVEALASLAEGAGVGADEATRLGRIIRDTNDPLLAGEFAAAELGEEYRNVAIALGVLFESAQDSSFLDEIASKALIAAAASSEAADQLIVQAEGLTGASRSGEGAILVFQKFNELLAQQPQAIQDAVLGLEEVAAAEDAVAASTGGMVKSFENIGPVVEELGSLEDALKFDTGAKSIVKNFSDIGGEVGELEAIFGATREATDAAAEAAGDAEQEFSALAEISSDMSDDLDDAASAADRLRTAIDRVTAPADDLRETTRGVHEELANMNAALEENGTTFDATTEAGRANQEQLEQTRDALFAHGVALVQNGASAEDAAGDILYNVDSLNRQWRAAGLTEEQIAALNAEYGLTPEQVDTVLALEGEALANEVIRRYNDKLDDIPETERTAIKALIDEGAYAEANRRLDVLDNPRIVTFRPRVGGSISAESLILRAEGGYVDRPELGWTGEAGAEAVLPLTRPGRIRQLLGDPRISGPIYDALGGGGDVTNVAGGSVNVGTIAVGTRDDLPEAMDALDGLAWRLRVGAHQ